uniref:Glucanase n=1 Tax=Phanerodontia chrysosporium TaxID=2822231 RepID=Q01763_PHACH|nr:cellulase [Phanerodontia chrysosporium]
MRTALALILALAAFSAVSAQQAGTITAETHPTLTIQQCTQSGGCAPLTTKVVLDVNWRWIHSTTGYTNCYSGNTWDAILCPDPVTCAANCALDGADYTGTFGILPSGTSVTLRPVDGLGLRLFLLADDSHYQMFQLLNKEFTFDVEMPNMRCGSSGAIHLTAMDADGGLAKYPGNQAGAKYGTGFCSAQCPKGVKFINGQANVEGWLGTTATTGTGFFGSCCTDIALWEANDNSASFAPHPCTTNSQTRCSGSDCTADSGLCDADGCNFNSFRMGNTTFFGAGMSVDTTKLFTVVTQFITSDNTSMGALVEIHRLYIQNGQVIQNSVVNIPGINPATSITDDLCAQENAAFGGTSSFAQHGGLAQVGEALRSGMVLALSIVNSAADTLWLDSNYPADADPSAPGVARGTCPQDSASIPEAPTPSVVFSNIKLGDIGTTFGAGSALFSGRSPPGPVPGSAPASSATATAPPFGSQCGGLGYAGPTGVCPSPYTCQALNIYYSQCI